MRTFRRRRVTMAHVEATLKHWMPRGVRAVHFTGGEPTLHPDLLAVLQRCAALGLRTGLGTNGWRLSEPAYAARIAPLLDEVIVSLHGPNAEVHDALTLRPGSFDRAVRALRHVSRPGVNVVVTPASLPTLVDTVRFAVTLGAAFILISAVSPEGAGNDAYDTLAVPLSAWPAAAEAVVRAVGDEVPVRFFGLPACALGAARARSNDLYWSPRVTVEWAARPTGARLTSVVSMKPDRGRAPVAACADCPWAKACAGPFVRYVERYGDTELCAIGGSDRGTTPPQP